MPVKIRLQRHGKKGKPFYWIVAADSRSKRDGKYLEKLGAGFKLTRNDFQDSLPEIRSIIIGTISRMLSATNK